MRPLCPFASVVRCECHVFNEWSICAQLRNQYMFKIVIMDNYFRNCYRLLNIANAGKINKSAVKLEFYYTTEIHLSYNSKNILLKYPGII